MGYKKKINKTDIIQSEIVKRLNAITRLGESRHEAKLSSSDGRLPFIYSIKTYENYKKTMEVFTEYCLKNHPKEIHHISDTEAYIEEYIS